MTRGGWPGLAAAVAGLAVVSAQPQTKPPVKTMTQGPHRMEIVLERHDKGGWRQIDPGLVLEQGDQVRFRFRTNFEGYLYVTNQSSSGRYQQLFPLAETGQNNRIVASQEYQIPATSMVFTIAPPAGYETVYWLVSPGRMTDRPAAPPQVRPESPAAQTDRQMTPRCDDTIWRARGDCIDSGAGPKLVPRGEQAPEGMPGTAAENSRDLFFMRQEDKAVISSPAPLTGPVIYEYRLAHK